MRNERKGRNSRDILRRWCSGESNALVIPERRKFRRVHGLQLPLHPQQVTGWVVILIIVVNTFAVLTPLLEPNLRPAFSIVIAAVFLTHICSHLTVLLLDPADPRVRSQPTNKVLPEFDRRKHSHVIENGRCHLCNITTESKRTKHCSICNKCIVRFDHHCKWLNNCIGARNYRAFLVCLISAILASLFVAGLSATELSFSLFFTDRFAGPTTMESNNNNNNNNSNNTTTTEPVIPFIAPASDTTLIIAISAIGILSAIVAILLLHLCFFHGYIACLGLTTYEYVRNKREKNSVAAAVAIAAAATAAAAAAAAASSTATATATASASASTTTATATSSVATTTVTTVTENASTITIQQIVPDNSSRLRYGFCEFVSSPHRPLASRSFPNDANLCSRRGTNNDCTDDRIVESLEGKPRVNQAPSPRFSRRKNEREKRNFRLCFSTYELEPSPRLGNQQHSETTASSTGGEISTDTDVVSVTTDVSRNSNATAAAAATTDLSTPSPVFCCFATLNSALTMHCCVTNSGRPGVQDHHPGVESKKRSSCDDTPDRVVRASANSCETVERIGRFLRTYLSKGKRRRRCKKKRKGRQQSFDVTGSTLQMAKSKGLDSADFDRNRTTIEEDTVVSSSSSSSSSQLAVTATDSSPQTAVPINTMAVTTTTTSRSYLKSKSALHRSSLITEFDLLDTQQQQQNRSLLRSSTYRRPSAHFFLRRGQKAKMNSQIITQSIKLSPILESELSKPVTPRSTHSSLSSYSGLSNRSICSTSSSSSSSQVARDSPFHEKCEIHRIE